MPALKKDTWLYPALICIICFIVSLLNRQNPFDMTYMRYDSSIYQYIGWQMTEGKIPYRDIFDHKGPVIYFWNMLGYGLHPMLGQWFLEFCALFVSAILAFKMGCRFISPVICTLIIGIIFFNTPAADTIGNIVSLAVSLSYICLYILLFYVSDNKISPAHSFILGIICALLLLLKPTYLALPAVILTYIAVSTLYQKKYSEFILFALCSICSFLLIITIICGWLQYHHALADFWQYYVIFNLRYARYWQTSNSFNYIWHIFSHQFIVILTLTAMLTALLQYKLYTDKEYRLILCISLATVLTLIGIILPNNPFLHYLYILSPLSFFLLIMAIKPWKQHRNTCYILCTACLLISLGECLKNITTPVSDKNSKQAAQIIKTIIPPSEPFQTLGWDMARLHLLSLRKASTPYVMTGMFDRLFPDMLYRQIQNSHPSLIVILTTERHVYYNLLQNYWPNFNQDYSLIYKNAEYEIYISNKRAK